MKHEFTLPHDSPLKNLKVSRIYLPIVVGLGFVGFMLYRSLDLSTFSIVRFTWQTAFWLFVAVILVVFRDLGYIIRIRLLSDNEYTWMQAFRVIMLWEFTSAVTPSAVGGTSIAMLYLHKEGLSLGRSTSVVLTVSFLDELYFVVMFPLLLLLIGPKALFTITGASSMSHDFLTFTLIGYSLKFAHTLLVGYGLFINPRGMKWLLLKIFKLPFLKKWKHHANVIGTDIVETSIVLKGKDSSFWFKNILASFFAWTSKYWVVNTLFIAFFAVNDHFLLFARQLFLWIAMLVSPTPGASGFYEAGFMRYLGDTLCSGSTVSVVGLVALFALLWRLLTYYPYLFIGAYLLPRWIGKHFGKKGE